MSTATPTTPVPYSHARVDMLRAEIETAALTCDWSPADMRALAHRATDDASMRSALRMVANRWDALRSR